MSCFYKGNITGWKKTLQIRNVLILVRTGGTTRYRLGEMPQKGEHRDVGWGSLLCDTQMGVSGDVSEWGPACKPAHRDPPASPWDLQNQTQPLAKGIPQNLYFFLPWPTDCHFFPLIVFSAEACSRCNKSKLFFNEKNYFDEILVQQHIQ